MSRAFRILLLVPAVLLGGHALGDEPVKPIRALLITGGCCHDYTRQKKILSEGISARAPVEWTIIQQGGSTTDTKIPFYEKDDWYKGFDVVVHNECFAGVTDPKWTERIIKPHREGLAAIVIHCAMHCYRDKTDEWFKFLGVTSHGHGAGYPFKVVNLAKDNPIMKGFGDSWDTPAGELYIISKIWETATPLAHARSRDTKKDEVCIWTNTYGKGRVFGTTIGHNNVEMSDPVFLNYMTRGLLWSVGKLDDAHLKPAETQADRPLVPENLALKKPATASASQDDEKGPGAGNDGNPDTRWCAPDNSAGYWWQVDLGKPEDLTGCKITWEHEDAGYRYKVEGSEDGKTWILLSDQSKSTERDQERTHKFLARGVRYVRMTLTGLEDGHWGSFFEFEVLGTNMVPAPVGAGASTRPRSIGGKGLLAGIKAPEGFQVTLFAAPPDVSYPTCLAATPTGEVYVGIDENGSLDAKPGRGRVVRCVDTDGDGKADRFTDFAKMDSPRGIIVEDTHIANGVVAYVLHPPLLTAFYDKDRDGVSDSSEVLVKGLGFDLKFRGADHTTNGIRMGIDGWIYVAVGDYGFVKAEGKDGSTSQLRGGGIVRVQPNGSHLEIYSRGQRNIYDVAIDPYMNLFTRDNTNDGGGWDVRLSHIIPTGHYGYPTLFTRFSDEIVAPLADYGGGSPTGSLYVQEPGLPPGYNDSLYTCEWGRSGVFRHPLTPKGAGFEAGQEPFLELPRPTDMDVDAQSRLYVASWRDGGFTYDKPDVGYVIRVTYPGAVVAPFPDLKKAKLEELIRLLESPSDTVRLAASRTICHRAEAIPLSGRNNDSIYINPLVKLINSDRPLASRVAAIFTLAQLHTNRPVQHELALCLERDDLREFALRAFDSRAHILRNNLVPVDGKTHPLLQRFITALADPNPRVRLQAAVLLGRLDEHGTAAAILPLTDDADPLVAHAAVNALVALKATDVCLKALDPATPKLIPGAVRVLQSLHDTPTVDGLIEHLKSSSDEQVRRATLKALCRLYFKEADWKGDWWTTRPDTTGPYYNPVTWDQSEKIASTLRDALKQGGPETSSWLISEMIRHRIDFDETTTQAIHLAESTPALRRTLVELLPRRRPPSAEAIRFLGTVASSDRDEPALKAEALRGLHRHLKEAGAFEAALPALAAIVAQKEPHNDLADALRDILNDPRLAGHVQDFIKLADDPDASRSLLGLEALIQVGRNDRANGDARQKASAAIEAAWSRPEIVPRLLHAVARTQAPRYAFQVRARLHDGSPEIRSAAEEAARELKLDVSASEGEPISKLPFDEVVAKIQKEAGDPKVGARLFERQGCIGCHTVSQTEALKGPSLVGITARYNRAELTESILKPSAKIAQGFETQKFATTSGQVHEGFVVRESGDEVEFRNSAGVVTVLPKKEIEERGKTETSVMPLGLVDPLTVPEFASLLSYLESLKSK
ncbi:DUF7133 domain-containing protein [Singulisphaera sp. PoT]|uniref:DUF7133 domain-containing protein n=1 Tax=Singulisphaera sp. PoT TaxID=3411797 RepID=UPI003BF5A3A0